MPRVRVLRPHANPRGIGVYRVGDSYDESPSYAQQKVNAGFVEYMDEPKAVRSKESPEMYSRVEAPASEIPEEEALSIESRKGGWYYLSDGSKALGKSAAAERLGVSVEELEDVDSDDE